MNKSKRQSLANAVDYLNKASGIVDDVIQDEEDCLGNMPDNLQNSERFESMENAIEHMREASEMISSAVEELEEAQS